MRLKNMWKRFWTLDVHNHAGFTLVELIIVIAILAILSTGAIAGYSAYVESANKTADKALIAEIENVLTLAYYNGDITANGLVVLSAIDDATVEGDQLEAALVGAFGNNWPQALKLKYTGWTTYSDTSFAGKEEVLLNKVDSLTNALNDAIQDAAGDNFANFMDANGIDVSDAGGAAVLYVAQATSSLKTEEQKKAFTDAITNNITPEEMVGDLTVVFGGLNNGGHVAAVAAVYALAEVYCLENNLDITLETGSITDVESATLAVQEMFTKISTEEGVEKLQTYLKEDAANDALAYLEVMSTVNTSKNTIIDKGLGNFSSLSSLFLAYAEGAVIVLVELDEEGVYVYNTISED